MAVVTLAQIKEHLSFTDDIGAADDVLLQRIVDSAQNHVERLLGFNIEDEFEDVPPALVEAVSQLAAWWYEQRETATMSPAQEVPFGVNEIVREYRQWAF